jgi:hypothetical protein
MQHALSIQEIEQVAKSMDLLFNLTNDVDSFDIY